MGSPDANTGKCNVIFTICILLLASLPTSALLFSFKASAQEEPSIREPTKLYVGANWGFWYGPDAGGDIPMMVWNRTKQLGEFANLSNYGEYSVFISEYDFLYGDSGPYHDEWFVVASTLQPDDNGIIHQVALLVLYDFGWLAGTQISYPLLKSYAENCSFNQTSIEDEKNIIRAVLVNESLDPSVLSDADFLVNYPFLTVLPVNTFVGGGVGVTVILNLCTGKVMLAALTDSAGLDGVESRMLYPDWQPPPVPYASFDLGYRLGDSANGMICISARTGWYKTWDLPWNYVPITEVSVNGTKVENTSPQLPLTLPPGGDNIALNVTMMVKPGDSFIVTLVSSKGENFTNELHVPITVRLSVSDVTFYVENGTRKTSFDLSNTGCMTANISKVLIGKSPSALRDQMIPTFAVDSGATRTVIEDFDWNNTDTYYFEVLCPSGESLNWSTQAPFDVATARVLLSMESQTVSVEEGDVFNVTVREFEPMPIEDERLNNGIAGIQFTLNWNSSILNATKMTEVMFHAATPENEWDNVWQIENRIDNTLGTAEYAVTWQDGPRAIDGGYAPIFGNNTVAIITLKAVGTGSTPIHFSNLKVGNPYASPIYSVAVDGNVNVNHVATDGSGNMNNRTVNDTKNIFPNGNTTQLQPDINSLIPPYNNLNSTLNNDKDSTQKDQTLPRSAVYVLIAVSAIFAAATAYLALTKTKPKAKRERVRVSEVERVRSVCLG